jgi:hypothetical protein
MKIPKYVVVLSLLWPALSGCGNDSKPSDNGDAGSTDEPNESDEALSGKEVTIDEAGLLAAIVGTWRRSIDNSTETLQFNADGSLKWTDSGDDEEDEMTGEWSLDGRLLGMGYEESGEEEGVSYTEREKEDVPIAIIDGELYMYAMVRTSGSGKGLDGTWALEAGYYEYWAEDGVLNEEYEESDELTIEISGGTADATLRYYGSDNEGAGVENFDESENDSSDIRLEGKVIYWSADIGIAGTAAPRSIEEPDECVMGVRVAEDIIIFEGYPSDQNGYERVD